MSEDAGAAMRAVLAELTVEQQRLRWKSLKEQLGEAPPPHELDRGAAARSARIARGSACTRTCSLTFS